MSVYRYQKSGKLAAISRDAGYVGLTVIELSPDMRTIVQVRHPKYVKHDAISKTPYQFEVVRTEVGREGDMMEFTYRPVRVLSSEDTDLDRWRSTDSLDELPVSPEKSFTIEERVWAGEDSGNTAGGFILATIAIGSTGLALDSLIFNESVSGFVFFFLTAAASGWALFRYSWKPKKSPDPIKLRELEEQKCALRQQAQTQYTEVRTAFGKALELYSTWERLTPEEFESAVSLRLENEGYKASRTQYSKDGGVDIEAVDSEGRPVIVQAKRYREKVGVAVVREMIGVRQSRTDTPRTMIFSLVGFTRGARQLAEQESIDLRDIRSELLRT